MTRARAAMAGVVATALALATAELLLALLPGAGSLFVAVGNAVIGAAPGPVVGFAIDTFGSANRLVLLSSMTVGMGVAGALIALGSVRRPWIAPVGFGLFGVAAAVAGAADPAVRTSSAVLAIVGGVVVGAAALAKVLDILRAGEPTRSGTEVEPLATRRRFLGWTAGLAGSAGMLLATGRFLQDRTTATVAPATTDLPAAAQALPPPAAGASLDVDGISPLVTPNEDFYRIDTAFTIPRVDASTHRIAFTGMVDRPFELTFDELLELVDTEVDVTLSCVSNQVGGDLIGTARWLGVPLADLLDRAGVQAGADQIVGRSVDGWTGGFPVEAAFDGRPAIIAVGMNGEPLPPRHGFPARLVIAGLYGYVSDTKWLSEIELTTFDAFDAYWVPRGWSALGPIKTQSRIDVPRDSATVDAGTVAVAGVAWSDERGVSAVEVAVDDGTWQPADLADELATTTWRQWVYRWDATPGNHVLRVRASDAGGEPQTADVSPPAPDGATGHHTILVSVSGPPDGP